MRNFLVLGGSLCVSLALVQTTTLRLETALQSLPQIPAWRLADLSFQSSQRAIRNLEQANLSRQEARKSVVIRLHTLNFAKRLTRQAKAQMAWLNLQNTLGFRLIGGSQ